MSNDDTKPTITLKSPNDWEDWDLAFRREAVYLRLWAFIDPDKPDNGTLAIDPSEKPSFSQ